MYSKLITLRKGIVSFLIFALPLLLEIAPEEWMNITLGSLGVMTINWLKHHRHLLNK